MVRDPKLGHLKIFLVRLFFFCQYLQRVKIAECNKIWQTKLVEYWGRSFFFWSSPQNPRYTNFCDTRVWSNPRKFVSSRGENLFFSVFGFHLTFLKWFWDGFWLSAAVPFFGLKNMENLIRIYMGRKFSCIFWFFFFFNNFGSLWKKVENHNHWTRSLQTWQSWERFSQSCEFESKN